MNGPGSVINALSVDVEEYFHPTELQGPATRESWHLYPSRVEEQVERVLDLFDQGGAKATFFILGWLAPKYPKMIRQILDRGHEVGCHSYGHNLVFDLTPQQFRNDTQHAVNAISDACGRAPIIYRAPSYSITEKSLWALEILVECGFTVDSSIYPISHDRYGIPTFSRHAQTIYTPSGPILEVPIATVRLFNEWVSPVGGGGYLRLLPYSYTVAGIRRINHKENAPACIYFHPWEIDPQQPRIAHGWISHLRTYGGLHTCERKVTRMMAEFRFESITTVYSTSGVLEPARS
jgi:polysaccharide deacetylase family protein (PEP-CTERM system associated)